MVQVKILYFASARDAASQKDFEMIELEDGSQTTLQAVIDIIKANHKDIASVLETSVISFNQEYCDNEKLDKIHVKDNDEIAIIPPN
ncbi:hypothetical protein LPJ64_002631 [Coemansia asiatica]|uniref:Molybdopterin synthase sulfur carrier subunit n=1 Tax=Coemansia asiatica TaxID=1052880 RepID=A0A9W7XJA6_9FUNG|nr:hypothetical protein LPJ64_002631 [Coemansia asiatica]